jgi:capsular exopolysaccharide synthesis family protein
MMATASAFEPASLDILVRQTIRAWRRNKLLFGAGFLGVLVVGFTVLFAIAPRYTTSATVVIVPPASDPISADTAPMMDPTQDDSWPITVASLMQSRDVAGAVLAQYPPTPAKPGLRDLLCGKGMHFICHPTLSPAEQREAQIDRFLKNLAVMPEPHSRVIDVTVTAGDPQRAALLADSVVQNYQQIALAQQTTAAQRDSNWLVARTGELQQDWLNAQQQADAYSASHHLAMPDAGTSNVPLIDQQISDVAANLATAQSQLDNAEAQTATLHDASRQGDASAMVAMQSQPVLVAAASNLMQLESSRDQLAAEFGPNYPKIQALDQQIAATKSELNGQTGTALAGIRENLVTARTQVRQLTAQLNQLRTEAVTQGPEEAALMALTTKAASMQSAYQSFLQHSGEVMDRNALQEPPVALVSAAGVPLQASYPDRLKFGIGILFLALAAGTTAILIKDRAGQGFGQADDLRSSAQLPLLATLPALPARHGDIGRHVLDEPYSRTSEAVRGIAATLALLAGEQAGPRAVLITSAGPLEGKSTLALWLATTARQTGQRVLLVDGDHRRGTLMQDANAKEAPGLTDLLARKATLKDVVQIDPRTNVSFISAGTASACSFGSADIVRLRRVMNSLKKSYSLIVIDSPPLLAMVDGLVLGSIADQTVFVCRWQHSSRQAVMASLDRMRTYGAQVAGIVVSMVEQEATLDFNGDYSRRESELINRFYGS